MCRLITGLQDKSMQWYPQRGMVPGRDAGCRTDLTPLVLWRLRRVTFLSTAWL